MARMPGATWRPTNNCTPGGQQSVRGIVLHIMEGTLDGSDSWFKNPDSQASSHFGVGKDGRIYQWVDTADRAWAQVGGNRDWLSIEHEGHTGDSLTAAQLAADGRIIAWAHQVHGVPLQSTDDPAGTGIGWHGMGGSAWGGHYDCPGNPIKGQRAELIRQAQQLINPSPEEDDMPTADEIAQAVWNFPVPIPRRNPDGTVRYEPNKQGASWPLVWGNIWSAESAARDAALQAAVASLAGLLAQHHDGLTAQQVEDAVKAAIADSLVHVQVDVATPDHTA